MPNQSDKEFKSCQNDTFETTPLLFQTNTNTPDYLGFFKKIATKIVDGENEYYHVPFYFKDKGDGESFEMFLFDQLPPYIQELAESEEVTQLKKELALTEQLWEDNLKVIEAIPECPTHGNHCIPHALEWIEEKKNTYHED